MKLLYDYHVWSYIALMEHLETYLPQVLFNEPVQSSFASIALTLEHIYLIDRTWFEAAQGRSPLFPQSADEGQENPAGRKDMRDIQMVKDRFIRLHLDFGALLSAPETKMETEIRFKNNRGGETALSLEEAVVTMATHGAYHRGAVSSILRQLGYCSKSFEFVSYFKTRKKRS